jgi:hypothetical protein
MLSAPCALASLQVGDAMFLFSQRILAFILNQVHQMDVSQGCTENFQAADGIGIKLLRGSSIFMQ